jgi:thiol:disulfide interchange protein DsbD
MRTGACPARNWSASPSPTPSVQARLKDVLLLQADVTANSADDKALLARFKLFGPPGIIFFDKAGNEVAYRVIGYEPADKFLASLGQAIP